MSHETERLELRHCGETFYLDELWGLYCPHCKHQLRLLIVEDSVIPWWPVGKYGHGAVKRAGIPELPEHRRERYREDDGLNREIASKITSSKVISDLYDETKGEHPKVAATYVTDILLGELHHREMEPQELDGDLTPVVEALGDDEITQEQAVEATREWLDTDADLSELIEEAKGAEFDLESLVQEAIEQNEEAVEDYRSGQEQAINSLVGYVMAESGGAAEALKVRELLQENI